MKYARLCDRRKSPELWGHKGNEPSLGSPRMGCCSRLASAGSQRVNGRESWVGYKRREGGASERKLLEQGGQNHVCWWRGRLEELVDIKVLGLSLDSKGEPVKSCKKENGFDLLCGGRAGEGQNWMQGIQLGGLSKGTNCDVLRAGRESSG